MPLPHQKIGKKSRMLPPSSSVRTAEPPPTCPCHARCCHCHISLGFPSDKGYFATPRKHGSVFSSWSQHNITDTERSWPILHRRGHEFLQVMSGGSGRTTKFTMSDLEI